MIACVFDGPIVSDLKSRVPAHRFESIKFGAGKAEAWI